MNIWVFAATLAAMFVSLFDAAWAQTMTMELPTQEEVALHDTGWNQFKDLTEFGIFLLDVFVVIALTTVFVFHPSIRLKRQTVADFELPKALFTYALIGLVVGFLVVYHGYLIGFVIFGIGGLLRFRTSTEAAGETTLMILVTVIGLCVGLNIPLIAILITIFAATIYYVTGALEHHSFVVKFSEDKKVDAGITALRDRLGLPGVKVKAINRTALKPTVEFVLQTTRSANLEQVEEELRQARAEKGNGVADWHRSK